MKRSRGEVLCWDQNGGVLGSASLILPPLSSSRCASLSTLVCVLLTQDDSENPSSTPGSPTSAGFSTDRLPPNTSRTTDSYSDDDEAAVDPHVLPEDDEADAVEEEEEGEDLYNDNFMEYVPFPMIPASGFVLRPPFLR